VSARRLGLPAALLLAGAALLAHANGIPGGFTYDDKAIVRDNPRIRSPSSAGQLFTTQYFGGPPGSGTAYRPVLLLSFAVEWWIHGEDGTSFRAVNVLFHVLATLLLARLLLELELARPVALGAAVLFAVHPVHVEAIAGIVGRGETQAAVLMLLSLLLALRVDRGARRRRLAMAGALLAFLLAVLTKESAAVAPALLLLALAWKSDGGAAGRVRRAIADGWVYAAGAAVLLGGVFAVRRLVLGGALRAAGTGIFELENPLAPLRPLDRVANACAILFRYLGRLALPLRLSADESAWSLPVLTPRSVVFWAAPVLLAALAIASGWRILRATPRSGRRPEALGMLFFLVAFLPTSNLLFPTGTIFAERLAYLPSAGFCLAAAAAIAGRSPDRAALSSGRLAVLCGAVLLLAARTIVRNPVWENDETLFTNLVRASPNSAKAHYDFAYMSVAQDHVPRALAEYRRAAEIYPRYWDAWAGVGHCERLLGRLEDAERAYAESVRVQPAYENGWFGLGVTRQARGDDDGAERAWRTGLRRTPQSLPLAYRVAVLLSRQRRPQAIFAWRRALSIEPGSLPSRVGYGELLLSLGRIDEARRETAETLRMSPRYQPALDLQKRISRSESVGPERRAETRDRNPGSMHPMLVCRLFFAGEDLLRAAARGAGGDAWVPAVVEAQEGDDERVRHPRAEDREHAGPHDEGGQALPEVRSSERHPEIVVQKAVPRQPSSRRRRAHERVADAVAEGIHRGQRPRIPDEGSEQGVELVEPEDHRDADRHDRVEADERREADADADRHRGGDALGRFRAAHPLEDELQPQPLERTEAAVLRALLEGVGRVGIVRGSHAPASRWSCPSAATSRSPEGPRTTAPEPAVTEPIRVRGAPAEAASSSSAASRSSGTVKSSS
jgi:tetratricopeptide (TPR) repeat protein